MHHIEGDVLQVIEEGILRCTRHGLGRPKARWPVAGQSRESGVRHVPMRCYTSPWPASAFSNSLSLAFYGIQFSGTFIPVKGSPFRIRTSSNS